MEHLGSQTQQQKGDALTTKQQHKKSEIDSET